MWRGIHLMSHCCSALLRFGAVVLDWSRGCFVVCWWMRDAAMRSQCSWIRPSCRALASLSSRERRCAGSFASSERPCWELRDCSACPRHDSSGTVSHCNETIENQLRLEITIRVSSLTSSSLCFCWDFGWNLCQSVFHSHLRWLLHR